MGSHPELLDDKRTCLTGEWMSADALADWLDVKIGHVRALVARREIPYAKVGRLVRFHVPTIESWLTASAAPGHAHGGRR